MHLNTAEVQKLLEEVTGGLCQAAIWHMDRATWLVSDIRPKSEQSSGGSVVSSYGDKSAWETFNRSANSTIYDGVTGIAFALSQLTRSIYNPAIRQAAMGAFHQARYLSQQKGELNQPGFLAGEWGTEVALHLTARNLNLSHKFTNGWSIAEPLESFDQIDGLAGSLQAAILRCRLTGEPPNLVSELANQLCDRAHSGPGIGVSWLDDHHHLPLCGLAHGASSAGSVLLEAFKISESARFIEMAFASFEYERQWINRTSCTWPDLREEPPAYPFYWCHGAAGIGLSRLRAYQLTRSPQVEAEARTAVMGCEKYAMQLIRAVESINDAELNVSVCHGIGSVMETLIYGSKVLSEPRYLSTAWCLAKLVDGRRSATGSWQCGVLSGEETPGLFQGISGFAYVLSGLINPFEYNPLGLPATWID